MPFVPAAELDCPVPTAYQYVVRNTRYRIRLRTYG